MATILDRLRAGFMAGIKAFQEAYVTSGSGVDTIDVTTENFGSYVARRLRYDILWAYFESTAYRNIHTWAAMYRQKYGLYRYVRNIYNPAYRIGDFWRIHLMGGLLDPDAGDGKSVPSSLPIITKNEKLRPAIATIWRWSNWQIQKSIFSLYGAVLGDVGLQVIDDTDKNKVYLHVVHPSTIEDITLDTYGNVKGYLLTEPRIDPTDPRRRRLVTYREEVKREKDSENVVYRTYRDGEPFAWFNGQAEWTVPYGFVPMVIVQHNNIGGEWGWSELHAGLAKIREADDLASKLSDHIRKEVDPAWLFAGVAKSAREVKAKGASPTEDEPEPGREELKALYSADANARAQALVSNLDIAATMEYISSILTELERDYPELQLDIYDSASDSSGKALRIRRQKAEAKVIERRPLYDDALVRAQQMAVAIGGFRGLPGFEGFGLDSYNAGDLDHTIGQRPVFAIDPVDRLEQDRLFWETAQAAVDAGYELEQYLRDHGYTDEQLARLGTVRLARIKADQEDAIPNLPEGQKQ